MDLNKIRKAARDQGWEVAPTRKGHWAFTSPDGQTYIASGTPGDVRSLRNTVAALVRMGLDWPPPTKKQLRSRRRRVEETK